MGEYVGTVSISSISSSEGASVVLSVDEGASVVSSFSFITALGVSVVLALSLSEDGASVPSSLEFSATEGAAVMMSMEFGVFVGTFPVSISLFGDFEGTSVMISTLVDGDSVFGECIDGDTDGDCDGLVIILSS